MRNECNIIRDILPLYVEDIVSEDTKDYVDEHLAGCEACRNELDTLKDTDKIYNIKVTEENDIMPLKAFRRKINGRNIFIALISSLSTAAILLGMMFPMFSLSHTDYSVVYIGLLIAVFFFGFQLMFCLNAKSMAIKLIPAYVSALGFILCGIMFLSGDFALSIFAVMLAVVLVISCLGVSLAWAVYGYINSRRDELIIKYPKLKLNIVIPSVCILTAVGLIIAHSSGLFVAWNTSCGEINHDIIVHDGYTYFSEKGKGAYIYYEDTKNIKRITKFDSTLKATTSGLYLIDNEKWEIYSVTGSNISQIASMESYLSDDESVDFCLIDIIDNVIYWRTTKYSRHSEEKTVFATDIITAKTEELTPISDSHRPMEKIRDDMLYYPSVGGGINYYDLTTKEQTAAYELPEGTEDEIINVFYYDDFMVFTTNSLMYKLEYDSDEPELLTDIIPTSSAFDRVGDKLYYMAVFYDDNEEAVSKDYLVSFDLNTNKLSKIMQLSGGEGGIGHYFTEIVICKDGYYFTDPSISDNGGMYYYNNDTGDILQIIR